MKRLLLLCVCALTVCGMLLGCAHEKDPQTPSTEATLPAGTETDVPETLAPLPPEQIAAALSGNASPLQITPLTKQVTLSQQELTDVQKAFTGRGYSVVPACPAAGTKLKTVVLQNDDRIVTLIAESGGSIHVLWESAKKVSIAPLTVPEETRTGEGTMVQIGIARVSETDNPMIGMCYLYRLSDGSAVILDGGCNNDKCAVNLYQALKKLEIAKTEDGKLRIRAWIFSHGHGDHIGTFQKFTAKYAGKYEIGAVMYAFPSAKMGISGCDAEQFELSLKAACPSALRISPHAGLCYRFGDLAVHVLYNPELLYPTKTGISYFNHTSLILKIEMNGKTVLHLGDAGEQAAGKAWKENNSAAFASDLLQITHHGLYTGPDSHDWKALKKIYDAASAAYGLLPMGTRKPADARDGRYSVLIGWGVGMKFHASYVLDLSDNRGFTNLSQEDYVRFTENAEKNAGKAGTLYGFDGINIAKNQKGMITYLSASENDPMATEFLLSGSGITVTANERLSDWLAG